MKIAIFSDVHENFHNLVLAIEKSQELWVEKIIFLWDFINNWIAKIMASSPIPIFAIWWNNDWDKVAITKTSLWKDSNLEVWFDTFDIIEIDNRKIFLTHYPMLAKPMAKSWDFDAVFYGHDHKHNIDKINNCIVVNPWELSAHKFWEASFSLYDTNTNSAEILFLDWHISFKTNKADEYRENSWIKFSASKTHQY